MRFRAWLVLIVLTGASTVKTQVPTAGQPTFRTGTTLVEMAVVVLNDNGLAIDDLDPADFDVREDGEPRALTIFRRVSAGTNVHAGSSPAIPGALIETSLSRISPSTGRMKPPTAFSKVDLPQPEGPRMT